MSASIQNTHFLLRRVHSLLGLAPVGGFLCFHLWENSLARKGPEYYNEHVVAMIQGMNYVLLMEIFVIALPILYHALYGTVIWYKGTGNITQYGYFRNWMWWIQRVSGFGILAFLVYHVGWTRIASIFDESIAQNMFGRMQEIVMNPIALAAYAIGLFLAVVHLANGIWTAGITWGITTTPRSQQISMAVVVALGCAILAFGLHGLTGFIPSLQAW